MSEFDSPWKEVLERFLEPCFRLFFPRAFAGIDWQRGYQSLDAEFQQIVRDAELGRRLADKLFKVWRRDGAEAWVLVHVEVQNQTDTAFPERMFVYHYRIYDRYQKPVANLAVLGDDVENWRPGHFECDLWDCKIQLDFPIVKLLDWTGREEELEADRNPMAAVVLAHLKTMETRSDALARKTWKMRVVRGLFERGISAEDVRQLFRLIDWMMDLPLELDQQFTEELHRYEEENKMPYVTSVERLALERGRDEGREALWHSIERGLELKFGPPGLELATSIRGISDLAVLREILDALWSAEKLADVKKFIK